eukprot:SAG31_NODE_4693_length_3029_cov_1.192833_4_plen_111_part_00
MCPLLEKHGTFIERCNALIEKVSTFTALPVESRWGAHVSAVKSTLESGIEISGNHDLAKLINASFHTLVAALRKEEEYWYSSSPGGLATDCCELPILLLPPHLPHPSNVV